MSGRHVLYLVDFLSGRPPRLFQVKVSLCIPIQSCSDVPSASASRIAVSAVTARHVPDGRQALQGTVRRCQGRARRAAGEALDRAGQSETGQATGCQGQRGEQEGTGYQRDLSNATIDKATIAVSLID